MLKKLDKEDEASSLGYCITRKFMIYAGHTVLLG
jgi:hypothetical protein